MLWRHDANSLISAMFKVTYRKCVVLSRSKGYVWIGSGAKWQLYSRGKLEIAQHIIGSLSLSDRVAEGGRIWYTLIVLRWQVLYCTYCLTHYTAYL